MNVMIVIWRIFSVLAASNSVYALIHKMISAILNIRYRVNLVLRVNCATYFSLAKPQFNISFCWSSCIFFCWCWENIFYAELRECWPAFNKFAIDIHGDLLLMTFVAFCVHFIVEMKNNRFPIMVATVVQTRNWKFKICFVKLFCLVKKK